MNAAITKFLAPLQSSTKQVRNFVRRNPYPTATITGVALAILIYASSKYFKLDPQGPGKLLRVSSENNQRIPPPLSSESSPNSQTSTVVSNSQLTVSGSATLLASGRFSDRLSPAALDSRLTFFDVAPLKGLVKFFYRLPTVTPNFPLTVPFHLLFKNELKNFLRNKPSGNNSRAESNLSSTTVIGSYNRPREVSNGFSVTVGNAPHDHGGPNTVSQSSSGPLATAEQIEELNRIHEIEGMSDDLSRDLRDYVMIEHDELPPVEDQSFASMLLGAAERFIENTMVVSSAMLGALNKNFLEKATIMTRDEKYYELIYQLKNHYIDTESRNDLTSTKNKLQQLRNDWDRLLREDGSYDNNSEQIREFKSFLDSINICLAFLDAPMPTANYKQVYSEFYTAFSDGVLNSRFYTDPNALERLELRGYKPEHLKILQHFCNQLTKTLYLEVAMVAKGREILKAVLKESYQKLNDHEESVGRDTIEYREVVTNPDQLIESFLHDCKILKDHQASNVQNSGILARARVNFDKFLGHINSSFSPQRMRNYISKVANIPMEGGREISLLRMGCCTTSNIKGDTIVEQTFRNLVTSMTGDTNYGYFNLQNNGRSITLPTQLSCFQDIADLFGRFFGDESSRVRAFEKLVVERGPEFARFRHFVFPMDGGLWNLTSKAYKNNNSISTFKNSFKVFFSSRKPKKEGQPYFEYHSLPCAIRRLGENDIKNLHGIFFDNCISPIQREFFQEDMYFSPIAWGAISNQEYLDKMGDLTSRVRDSHYKQIYKNKRAFLFLSYIALFYGFCKAHNISVTSLICKDGIDRGGSFTTLVMLVEKLLENEEKIIQEQAGVETPGEFGPTLQAIFSDIRFDANQFPFLVKQQPIVDGRQAHLVAALHMIASNPLATIRCFKEVKKVAIPTADEAINLRTSNG